MGIELPAELAGVANAAGVHWPQADEDKMRTAAQAWRDAGGKLNTLVTDSDNTARSTVSHMQGDAGQAATKHWSTFVQPDTGHLTATVKGCTAAADRLDHAADQVSTAKTEIVRQLVALARNSDAANTAAASGHPTALAGLDTFVKGTSANVATINQSLVHAVRPDSGVEVSATQAPAHAGPGEHGLTSTVDSLAGRAHHPTPSLTGLVDNTTAAVTGTAHGATGLVDNTAAAVNDTVQGATGHGHGASGLVDNTTAAVTGTVHGASGLVDNTAAAVNDTVQGATGHGHGATGLVDNTAAAVNDTVHGASGLVDNTGAAVNDTVQGATGHGHDVVQGATGLVDGTAANLTGPGHGHGPANLVDPGQATNLGDITAGDTGPIPAHHPDAPTPATGLPLPPDANQVVSAAGLAGPAQPVNLPVDAAPAGNPVPGAAPPAPAPQGAPGGYSPAAPGGYGPAAPGPAAPGGAAGPGGLGASGPGRPIGPAAPIGARPDMQPSAPSPGHAAQRPAPLRDGPLSAAAPPPPAAQPAAAVPPGHKTEREQLVAFLIVHMFPIGHMPVAASEPARQLPSPPPEVDYAAGLRFAPDDHPQAHLVGAATPPGEVSTLDPLPADAELVHELVAEHDPLGDLHERDWDRRFLVRKAGPQGDVEYAWPPGELYPEGGSAPGEPEVLEADTLLDRFGGEDGRVFAAQGTPFPQRALPPSHVDAGYRCYRVLAPIPVWRAVSAAWFGQPGGGVRYRTTRSAAELVALGHLEDVTAQQPGGAA